MKALLIGLLIAGIVESPALADKNDGGKTPAAATLTFEDIKGSWCSDRFEMKLTRKALFSKNLTRPVGKSYSVANYRYHPGYFRVTYWGDNYERQFAYEFHHSGKAPRVLILRQIRYRGAWRPVGARYSRACK